MHCKYVLNTLFGTWQIAVQPCSSFTSFLTNGWQWVPRAGTLPYNAGCIAPWYLFVSLPTSSTTKEVGKRTTWLMTRRDAGFVTLLSVHLFSRTLGSLTLCAGWPWLHCLQCANSIHWYLRLGDTRRNRGHPSPSSFPIIPATCVKRYLYSSSPNDPPLMPCTSSRV